LEFDTLESRACPSSAAVVQNGGPAYNVAPAAAPLTSVASALNTGEAIHHTTPTLPITFRYQNFNIRNLTALELPYDTGTPPSLGGHGFQFEDGVVKFLYKGTLYDHPEEQADYALIMLDGYRQTGNAKYLERAEIQANRLLKTATHAHDALYFPYPFSFTRHSNPADGTMVAPWYSALAQGQALSVFVRLYEATGDQKYMSAATLTFNSFRNPRGSDSPWTVFVDASGYLWFEEYPINPPDRTLNGHIFAMFGLLDYWRLTGDPQAKMLLQAGLTTVRHYISEFREVGWISLYGLTYPVRDPHYHVLDTKLLYELYTITGDPYFARMADNFATDYSLSGKGTTFLAAGRHTGYQFGPGGQVLGSITVHLRHPSAGFASSRTRILGETGYWLYITDGAFAGYWVQENPASAYIRGIVQKYTYDPPRQLTFSAETYTGYDYASDGSVQKSLQVTLSSTTRMQASARAIIDGRLSWFVSNGSLAGYWVTAGTGLTLR